MNKERQTPAQREMLRTVRERMRAERLTLAELGGRIGCSAANLSRILSGKIGLAAEFETKLAASFSVEELDAESVMAIVRGMSPSELRLALQILQFVQGLQGDAASR